jgi:hypothetical protein
MNKTPDSNNGDKEQPKYIKTITPEERRNEYNRKKLALQNTPAGDPSRSFQSAMLRNEQANMVIDSNVADLSLASVKIVDAKVQTLKAEGKKVSSIVEDPSMVKQVTEDTQLQKAILQEPKPGFLKTADDLISERYARMRKERGEVSNTEPKPGFLKTADDLISERFARMRKEQAEKVAQQANTEGAVVSTPVDFDVTQPAPTEIDLNRSSDGRIEPTFENPKNQPLEFVHYSPEEYKAIGDEYIEAIKKSNEKIEKVETKLESRKQAGLEKLKNLGLTGLSKGLEGWKNANPKYKFALSIVLAGASVATGGATSIISKAMSAATFSSTFYDKEVKAKQEKGEEVKKGSIALKSIGLGIVAALATSELFSHSGEIADYVGEKASLVSGSVKDFFGSLFAGPVPLDPSTLVDPGTTMMSLPEYVIQSGDNLTSIISKDVLPFIPGAESLTDFQKENVIQNLLKIAGEHKDMPAFDVINQFTNPNMIHPGQTLDLEAIKKAVSELQMGNFDGKTLIERAKSL